MSLDYTVYNRMIAKERQRGQAEALDLRERAPGLDGTALIAEERKIPLFDGTKDYSDWPVGAPVREVVEGESQVFALLQPHNAIYYDGAPATQRALWSLCHTKDPALAKPWVAPLGTSGMYMAGECYRAGERVWRALQDNLVYDAEALPSAWEEVSV